MLCLVRCGETTWQQEGRLHGNTDLPLTEEARAAVRDAGGTLAGATPSTVYHPRDEAASETAQILAKGAAARTKDRDELADPALGLLEGLLLQDFAERYPKRHKQWEDDPVSLIPPEGEPIAEARARIFGAVARLLRKSRAPEVAVVLHPVGFGLLRCWLAGRPSDELWAMVRDAPRMERYAVANRLLDDLKQAAVTESAVG
jgi:broad specificity phosphatase PhoE